MLQIFKHIFLLNFCLRLLKKKFNIKKYLIGTIEKKKKRLQINNQDLVFIYQKHFKIFQVFVKEN